MRKDNILLGEFLVKQGLINQDQLEQALNHQQRSGKLLGRNLVELGFINESDMIKALGSQLGVQHIDLKNIHVPLDTIQVVPETVAKTYKLLPLYRNEETITVGMSNPLDLIAIDAVSRSTGLKVKPVVCVSEEIDEAIDYYYRSPHFGGRSDESSLFGASDSVEYLNDPATLFSEDEKVFCYSDEMSVSHLVHLFLVQSVHENASTIHVAPAESSLKIRFRINGDLKEYYVHNEKLKETIIATLKNLAYMDINRCDIPQMGSFQLRIDSNDIHFLATSLPTVYGESMVLKIMRPLAGKQVDDLGIPTHIIKQFMALISQPSGIVWFTGTLESGKTTSLYATLSELSRRNKDIITFERDVFFPNDKFRQYQPTYRHEATPDKILDALFRQDADVIAIDGFSNAAIIDAISMMALKGKLVFATLPCASAAKSLEFLANQCENPFLIADSTRGIIAQALIKRVCPDCRNIYQPATEELAMLAEMPEIPNPKFYRGSGCATCRGTGYLNQFPIFEMVAADETIQSLILTKASPQKIYQYLQQIGNASLLNEAIRRMQAGETTLQEVIRIKQLVN
ncbi:MAG: GspE/PulE family protein [Candidatus Zhuqueibacterota bacterium]